MTLPDAVAPEMTMPSLTEWMVFDAIVLFAESILIPAPEKKSRISRPRISDPQNRSPARGR